MNDVGLGELLLRMVISLGVVLAVVFGAYVLIRRRQGAGAAPRGRRMPGAGLVRSGIRGGSRGASGSATGGRRSGLRVLARVGLGRTSSVVAVQFADRVFMVGASEQGAPAVLAELDLEEWYRSTQQSDELSPIARRSTASDAAGDGPRPNTTARPGVIDALREATTRRG